MTGIPCSSWNCSMWATIEETWWTEDGSVCKRWWCGQHAPKPAAKVAQASGEET